LAFGISEGRGSLDLISFSDPSCSGPAFVYANVHSSIWVAIKYCVVMVKGWLNWNLGGYSQC